MSDPKIVTDKSPKFLLGVQRDVMNSTRTVGGVDTDLWWRPVAAPTFAISGGSRNGQVLSPGEYISVTSLEGTTITLNTPLTDGRVVLSPAIAGYQVTKFTTTVWRAERTVTLQVVGGVDDGLPVSWEKRTNEAPPLSSWSGFAGGAATAPVATPGYPDPAGGSEAWRVQMTCVTGTSANISQLGSGTILPAAVRATRIRLRSMVGPTVMTLVSPTGSERVVTLGAAWGDYICPDQSATPPGSMRLRLRGSEGSSQSADILAWAPMTVAGRYLPPLTTQTDATLGPVQPDGSRSVTLAQDTPGLSWTDAPTGWEVVMTGLRSAQLVYTGDVSDPVTIEADLNAVIRYNEQLEIRGALAVYNDLTINGKLYITQELGF